MEEGGSSSGEVGGFTKPRPGIEHEPTADLFVANCGPAVGLSFDTIENSFSYFGPVAAVHPAGDSGTRVVVSFEKIDDAVAAKNAWNGHKCDALQGRIMFIQFSVFQPPSLVEDHHPVMTSSSECGIPGLVLYLDFVSKEEEKRLLAAVDQLPWQVLAKRRVQHFGYEFLYKSRNVDLSQKLGDLPPFVDQVVERLSALPELTESEEPSLPLDQLTINEYPRGVGLSPHIDTHSAFEGSILSLSLAGPCVMEFRRYANALEKESGTAIEDDKGSNSVSAKSRMERRALLLPRRSLIVLSDEARYGWHHYIPHHKIDHVNGEIMERGSRRVSFTFRKVRHGPCPCKFVRDCDSQVTGIASSPFLSNAESEECFDSDKLGGDTSQGISDESSIEHRINSQDLRKTVSRSESKRSFLTDQTIGEVGESLETSEFQQMKLNEHPPRYFSHPTPEIEKQYVHKVYDAIAPHFSSTRSAKWPKVAAFLDSLAPGSIIADSGCGNGKYLGLNPRCYFIGCDISPPLVAICSQRGHEALVADALHLPYRTNFFDAAISIAVLHHLSSDQRRIRAIEELVRVVCAGGKVLITVWAVEQEDSRLVKKWTPLLGKYTEEWVPDEDVKSHLKKSPSSSSLDIIQEGDGCGVPKLSEEQFAFDQIDEASSSDSSTSISTIEEQRGVQTGGKAQEPQQEYFVPWHLPYHRAEVNGASVAAVASGFARKDDKKGAVVYNRYYHVFAEGELERLTSKVRGAVIVDQFYDKSNWCVILQKL